MLTEDVTYWFFRLNGCLTIQNFIVHPDGPGGQRTDADLIAVRFPHRAELLTSGQPMQDHKLFENRLQVFLVEVKTGQCSINGPWRDPAKKNIQRVLNAVGVVQAGNQTEDVARDLYTDGRYRVAALDVRLILVGSSKRRQGRALRHSEEMTYDEILTFIHDRMATYFYQKAAHQQWDQTGHDLYTSATNAFPGDTPAFIKLWKTRMGI